MNESLSYGPPAVSPGGRFPVVRWPWVRAAGKFCLDRDYRTTILLRLLQGGSVHQTTALTWVNRYPAVFAACRDYFAGREDLRFLSFGCSTGEEVVTLRQYFPSAAIVGAEIHRGRLARCLSLGLDERIAFVHSDPPAIAAHGPYDAVFCMAVLQRTPREVRRSQLADLSRLYPFAKFDEEVARLDSVLKPGGLFVVQHAQYDFGDASMASRYKPLPGGPVCAPGPRFDRSGRRKRPRSDEPTVFVKKQ